MLNTQLLLHFDGVDASTTFVDNSNAPHIVSPVGNSQVDTAYSVFGTGSGLFDGTGDWLTVPDSPDWQLGGGSGDFTVDFRVRWSGTIGNTGFCGQSNGGGSNLKWAFYHNIFIAHCAKWNDTEGILKRSVVEVVAPERMTPG